MNSKQFKKELNRQVNSLPQRLADYNNLLDRNISDLENQIKCLIKEKENSIKQWKNSEDESIENQKEILSLLQELEKSYPGVKYNYSDYLAQGEEIRHYFYLNNYKFYHLLNHNVKVSYDLNHCECYLTDLFSCRKINNVYCMIEAEINDIFVYQIDCYGKVVFNKKNFKIIKSLKNKSFYSKLKKNFVNKYIDLQEEGFKMKLSKNIPSEIVALLKFL